MKITRKQLRSLVKESYEEVSSRDAISGAQTHMRKDGMSFQDFVGRVVDKLSLYDKWLDNTSVEGVVAELIGDSRGMVPEDESQGIAPSEVTGQSLNYPKRDPTMPDWWYKEQIAKGKWRD
jgi:hypothetical protein